MSSFPTVAGYEIKAHIASGSMGAVYDAIQTSLGARRALKVIHPHLAHDEEFLARFEREARSAAALRGDSIVTVIEFSRDSDPPFLAMEFIDGPTLAVLLRAVSPFPPEVACLMLHQVAQGLETAFEQDIIHRDLKPTNIMVTPKGRLKLADFGLAKSADETLTLSAVGQQIGTPAYMSPEQVTGGNVDHRSDLFSLGVIAYEMLCGERPFAGDTVAQVHTAIVRDEPERLCRKNPLVPRDLAEYVEHLLRKDPSDRPQDPSSVKEWLERFIESVDIRGRAKLLPRFVSDPPAVALRLRDNVVQSHLYRAHNLMAMGKEKARDALEVLSVVLHLDPSNEEARSVKDELLAILRGQDVRDLRDVMSEEATLILERSGVDLHLDRPDGSEMEGESTRVLPREHGSSSGATRPTEDSEASGSTPHVASDAERGGEGASDTTTAALPAPQPSAPPSSSSRRWVIPVVSVLVLVVGAYAIWGRGGDSGAGSQPPEEIIPPQAALVSITSTPTGAQVNWADRFLGVTPLEALPVDLERMRERGTLAIALEGYQPFALDVTLRSGEEYANIVNLIPSPEDAAAAGEIDPGSELRTEEPPAAEIDAIVRFDIRPAADLYVDGDLRHREATQVDVPVSIGRHSVEARHPELGMRRWSGPIEHGETRLFRRLLSQDRETAAVRIVAELRGGGTLRRVQVLADGEPLPGTIETPGVIEIPVGEHDPMISLAKDGAAFEPAGIPVRLVPGETTSAAFTAECAHGFIKITATARAEVVIDGETLTRGGRGVRTPQRGIRLPCKREPYRISVTRTGSTPAPSHHEIRLIPGDTTHVHFEVVPQ